MEAENLHIVYGFDQLPMKISNFEIPCYILNNKQHVFSIKGIQKIFHYEGKSDFWLANIVNHITTLPEHLFNAYESPVIARISAEENSETMRIIDADVFVATCKIISETENHDTKADLAKIHKKAAVFYKTVQNENLHNLIEEASGYLFTKASVKTLLSKHLQEALHDPAYNWTQTIPDFFYEALFNRYDLDWKDALNDLHTVGKLFIDILYSRLTNELMIELQIQQPKRSYTKKGKQNKDAMHPKLKNYIDNVSALLETAGNNQYIFLQLLNRAYPINTDYQVVLPFVNQIKPLDSIFSGSLKKIS